MLFTCGDCRGHVGTGFPSMCPQCGGTGLVDVPECPHTQLVRKGGGYVCAKCGGAAEVTMAPTAGFTGFVWLPGSRVRA